MLSQCQNIHRKHGVDTQYSFILCVSRVEPELVRGAATAMTGQKIGAACNPVALNVDFKRCLAENAI